MNAGSSCDVYGWRCCIAICWRIKPAIHFTDKLDILEREKEKAIKIYGNQPNGLWWFGIPSGLKSELKRWSLKSRFRGILKKASEKNNALRRMKPRFEGSIN
ncbi:hypothetical protein AVEN_14269-1 [Araneus ventricosus]|uniref:Uncharacterized protein n=1 Tax=Araneus ventricosus TaxID=182803 RepID=A0A4Y2KBV6_ARAVE|nr:hypothetical protein AVEN_14269-1 [Araneus ventricosus]